MSLLMTNPQLKKDYEKRLQQLKSHVTSTMQAAPKVD